MTKHPRPKAAPRKKCPNKDCNNLLTPSEARNGYQCAECTRREEGSL